MLDRVLPAPRTGVRAHRLDKVIVRHDLAAVRREWEALLDRVPCSAYQTPQWVEPWLATRGRGVRPAFGVGLDPDGVAVALLPLGLERRGGLTVARFLGGRDTNTGLGLFDPAVPFPAADLDRLFAGIAAAAGIDLYWLANQPAAWAGQANPLLALPHHASPSFQHEADLEAGSSPSKRTRKHIRQKEGKLAECGPVHHLVADTPALAGRIAAALVAQRAARHGRDPDPGSLEAFLRLGGDGAVELHGLASGDEIIATFAGALHAGHLSGMLISFADDPRWTRFSPGELLLARVMDHHREAGTATFDLGVGEARYKTSFCPRTVPLFDTILGMTGRGHLAAAGWRAALAAKRRMKQSPRLWTAMQQIRRVAVR